MASSSFFWLRRAIAEVVVGRGEFRVEFDGLAEARRWPRPASPCLRRASAEADCRRRRISGRVRWPCGRRRWPRPASSGHAGQLPRLSVGVGVFRVEFDGLAEAGDGLVQLLLVAQGDAEVVVGHWRISGRVRWPCGKRRWPRAASSGRAEQCRGCCRQLAYRGATAMALLKIGDGCVELPRACRAIGTIEQRHRGCRAQGQRRREIANRLRVLPARSRSRPSSMIRPEVAGIGELHAPGQIQSGSAI